MKISIYTRTDNPYQLSNIDAYYQADTKTRGKIQAEALRNPAKVVKSGEISKVDDRW
jgi:hypothetical protein